MARSQRCAHSRTPPYAHRRHAHANAEVTRNLLCTVTMGVGEGAHEGDGCEGDGRDNGEDKGGLYVGGSRVRWFGGSVVRWSKVGSPPLRHPAHSGTVYIDSRHPGGGLSQGLSRGPNICYLRCIENAGHPISPPTDPYEGVVQSGSYFGHMSRSSGNFQKPSITFQMLRGRLPLAALHGTSGRVVISRILYNVLECSGRGSNPRFFDLQFNDVTTKLRHLIL